MFHDNQKSPTPPESFDQEVVLLSNNYQATSPLSSDISRTNMELSVLMSQYVKDTFSDGGFIDATVAKVVLVDFIKYMIHQ